LTSVLKQICFPEKIVTVASIPDDINDGL